jgi:hypothetical protein
MTRDDAIKLARAAGLLNCDCCLPFWEEDDQRNWKRFFMNFATLVEAKAAAAEREACLKLAEKYSEHWTADAIRARGEKDAS